MKFKERMEQLVGKLGAGIHERDEIIAVSLLGALAGQNTFLYGPPGTAKSLISRRISTAFKDAPYFECLMNRFTTPEEVYGPVSLSALKEDKYLRKTSGYLPKAEFGFLDEIWKSSPAVLNTLLTLTNERIFRNGDKTEYSPLKALFAASNETPLEGQGLDALYDRFTLRLLVPPMQQRESFENLLKSKPVTTEIEMPEDLKIDSDTWDQIVRGMHKIELSEETLIIISLIRKSLGSDLEVPVYVSDRRWQNAAIVMKASAFLCERKQTNHTDALLLRHCLWTKESNRETIVGIVEDAVRECGINTNNNIAELDRRKESLDQEIQKELFHREDVYKTEAFGVDRKKYFKVSGKVGGYSNNIAFELYISVDKMKTTGEFHPVKKTGEELTTYTCSFDAQGSCSIKHNRQRCNIPNFVPEVQFCKGDRKDNINFRLVQALQEDVYEVKAELIKMLKSVQECRVTNQYALDTPFVPEDVREIAIEGIQKQIDDLKLRIEDCTRLSALCSSPEPKNAVSYARII